MIWLGMGVLVIGRLELEGISDLSPLYLAGRLPFRLIARSHASTINLEDSARHVGASITAQE